MPYQEAARQLLRQSVFDATRELLDARDWGEVTMADIATAAGMSRQTLYNEFKSRQGVAQAYVLRLVDGYLDDVEKAVADHPFDVKVALREAFSGFLAGAASDPMVRSAILGIAKPDVMRLVTSEGAPVLEVATARLCRIFVESWADVDERDARLLSTHLVRSALSYVTLGPTAGEDPAADISELLAPFVDSVIGAQVSPGEPGR